MPPQKGKQGTKGQKQILNENTETLNFYRNMILGATTIYFGLGLIFFEEFATVDLVFVGCGFIVYFACYRFMASMAKPTLAADGSLVDEGCDLNIEGGIAEHIKDLIILTSGCHVLSAFSNYCWLIWLLAPLRAFHMLWKNVLAPWIFQEAPPEVPDERMEKKQRKMERKMRYRQ